MWRADSFEKYPDSGKGWRPEEKGTTEDEMFGWHHRLNGHEFKQTPGVGDGQGGLACCGSWSCEELDRTEQLNWTELNDYTTKQLILLKDVFFLKLCTNDYIRTMCPAEGVCLLLKNLLTNPVILKGLLWEWSGKIFLLLILIPLS